MSDVFYMLGIVAVGFALNFGLRALPFALFGTRKGELPSWVSKLGSLVSPVIIAGLVIYSYSGLECKTAWPYIAGVVTIGLQLWRRNPLLSIIAGTVVYMCLINCGCSTSRTIDLGDREPSFTCNTVGVFFNGERVNAFEVPEILEDMEIPKDRAINIQISPDMKDLRGPRMLMGILAKAGYRRSVLVTKQHAESYNLGKNKKQSAEVGLKKSRPQAIRYKRADE